MSVQGHQPRCKRTVPCPYHILLVIMLISHSVDFPGIYLFHSLLKSVVSFIISINFGFIFNIFFNFSVIFLLIILLMFIK